MGNVVKTGCIIAIKPGMLARYIDLHRNQPPEVRALMKAHGFLKCEIYVKEIAQKTYLFQYNEVEGDSSALYNHEVYQKWLAETGACQEPLPGESFWQDLTQVYAL